MITADEFLTGVCVAYTDMANRKIMAQCLPVPVVRSELYEVRLFSFHDLSLLKIYRMSRRSALSFLENHCDGVEKNVVLPFPKFGAGNADNSNQPL